MNLLQKAREILESETQTCVAICGEEIYRSKLRGVMPILDKIKEDPDFFEGASVADNVIGRAAALLLIQGNVKEIYASVISEHAIKILDEFKIITEYNEKVPFIMNRNQDGMCPMEESVLEINNPEQAVTVLEETLSRLRNSGK